MPASEYPAMARRVAPKADDNSNANPSRSKCVDSPIFMSDHRAGGGSRLSKVGLGSPCQPGFELGLG